jgi:T5SS/PEP-CTERM-associated repeat protein
MPTTNTRSIFLPRRCRATCLIALVLTGAALAHFGQPTAAYAADKFWDNFLGGTFSDAINWQGGSVAGAGDVAHFGLTTNPLLAQRIYTVSFAANAINQALKIEDDFVTFDLNGRTYATTAATGNHIGNQPGRSGRLTIIDGTISTATNSQLLVGDIASGTLTVSTGGRLIGSPSLSVGSSVLSTLVVDDGGIINAGEGVIGNFQGTTGIGTVTGAGSQWVSTSVLTVAQSGQGMLNITAGGFVQNTLGIVGGTSIGTGAVTVSGVGSQWNNTDALTVGFQGSGTLTITDGGLVRNTAGRIGAESGGTGTVAVSGANSQWINSGELTVGEKGSGTLNITGGGLVRNTAGRIGAVSGGTGTVTVSGAGSQWINEGVLVFAEASSGTLNVTDGGLVQSANAFVNGDFGMAAVTVSDTGSQWISGKFSVFQGTVNVDANGSITSDTGVIDALGTVNVNAGTLRVSSTDVFVGLVVGESATGTLNIGAAGQSNAANVVVDLGDMLIGRQSLSQGVVNVNGRGSILTVNARLGKPGTGLVVAAAGTGTLNISGGGSVNSVDSIIGLFGAGTGTVTVDGIDSNWTNSHRLIIGGATQAASGNGTLNIQNGGRVSSPQIIVGNAGTGTLRVSTGGILAADTIEVAKGPDSTGTVVIEGGSVNVGSLLIGRHGRLELSGGTLSLPSAALQAALPSIRWTGGTLHPTGSDLTIGTGGILGDSLALNARMGLQVDGALNVSAGASILGGGTVSAAGGTIDGTIGLIGGTLSYSQPAVNNGNLDALRMTLSFPGDGIKNNIGLTNNGTLTLADTTVNGDVHSPAGSAIKVAGGVIFNGLVSGAANFPGAAIVTFNGGFSPGDSPAAVTFGGDVTFGFSNTLEIELGGTTPGSQFDRVDIAGNAVLNGTLNVATISGFSPTLPGESFTIMTYGSHTGTFDAIVGQPSASLDGLSWTVNYTPGSVILSTSAIPGDINLDGEVDRTDAALFTPHLGLAGSAIWTTGDFDGDGMTTLLDLALMQTHFGAMVASASAAAIPEPASLTLTFLALAALLLNHRHAVRRKEESNP